MKERIYLDEKGQITEPGPDADKWLQCHFCGNIVPVFAAKQEAQIVTIAEPTDNPFAKSEVIGVGGKSQRKSRRKYMQDLSYIKEEDLKREIHKGAKLMSYHESQT